MPGPGDPTTPPDPQALQQSTEATQALGQASDQTATSLEHMGNAAGHAGDLLKGMSAITTFAQTELKKFETGLRESGINLKEMTSLTEGQTQVMGALSVAILGVRESYKALGGVDTGNLSTFTEQINDLSNIVKENPAGKLAGSIIENAKSVLIASGEAPKKVLEMAGKGATVFMEYAKGILQSADNGARLQNAFVQVSAAGGGLTKVLAAAGPELSGMNNLLAQQAAAMAKTEKATQLSSTEVEKYWAEIGKIPGALQQVVVSNTATAGTTSALTAAIDVARGTGRSYSAVIEDVTKMYKAYGASVQEGLTFTARMTEVANRVGAPFEDVHRALTASADAFKMFVTAGEEAARNSGQIAQVMTDYSTALQKVGVSASNSVEMVQNMLTGVKNLGIEQKSFISMSTGGPGGLMGGFQIEKMIRENRIGDVMDKVMTSMQRQFGGGKIVNFDEAAQSEAAARQYEKQIRLMTSGPTKIVNDRESAERLIDAMRQRQAGAPGAEKLGADILGKTMDTGVKLTQTTNTILGDIRADISDIRRQADIANLTATQKAFAARQGVADAGSSDAQVALRQNLRTKMNTASKETGVIAQEVDNNLSQGKSSPDRRKSEILRSSQQLWKTIFEDLPTGVKSAFDTLIQAAGAKDANTIKGDVDKLKADIATRKADFDRKKATMTVAQRQQAEAELAKEQKAIVSGTNILNLANQREVASAGTVTGGRQAPVPGVAGQTTPGSAGKQVGTAVQTATAAPPPPPAAGGGTTPATRPQDLNIYITGSFDVKMPDGSVVPVSPNAQAISKPRAP